MMRRARPQKTVWVWATASLLAASGCATVSPPPHDLATRHVGVPEAFTEAATGTAENSSDFLAGWLTELKDPRLEALVREALANNPDLYVAAARFEEAAASLRISRSYLSPSLNASGDASYTNTDGTSDEDAYSLGLGVSWEVDLWGRLRSDRAASRSVATASGLEYLQVRHSLAVAVVKAYYAIVTAKQQLDLDQQLLEAEQFTATTTSQRVDAGIGTSLDDDLAMSSVRLAEASVQQDLAALRQASRALELLLGRYPAAELDEPLNALPELTDGPIIVSVPSGLLERRPDIRSAEQLVNAAYYTVESAQAAKLPSLTLSADGTQFLDPSEFVSSVAAGILAPLYQGGRLDAKVLVADAYQRQTLGQFASISLNAFSEVENALSNDRFLRIREQNLAAASERLARASDIASNRYEQGLMTILDLQQIRRNDYSTRSLLLNVRYEQISQRLDLYLALGGPIFTEEDEAITDSQMKLLDPNSSESTVPFASGELHVGRTPETDSNPSSSSDKEDSDVD